MPLRTVPAKRSPYYVPGIGGATFVIGTEAVNAITVNVQLKDSKGGDLAERGKVEWFLSGDANGDTLAAAASGGVASGTDGHALAFVTGRYGYAVSEADGDIDLVITDNTVRNVYLVIVLPDGSLVVSTVIAFA